MEDSNDIKDDETVLDIKTRKESYRIVCPKSVADLILSPTTDPATKQSIIDSLIEAGKKNDSSKNDNSSAKVDTNTKTGNSTTKDDLPKETEKKPTQTMFHVWTDKEEDCLVYHRHERHDEFMKSRNHQKLWENICLELKAINCIVNAQQSFNKYAALKKKWKEIIDAPSGSEARYFRHKTSFDNLYGNKASTRPKAEIDTDKKEKKDEVTEKPKLDQKKAGKKGMNKRKNDVMEQMQQQYTDFTERMEKMHKDKMRRQDRLLDLYEREVNAKEQND